MGTLALGECDKRQNIKRQKKVTKILNIIA
jgi:hypothetical protein